MSDLQLAMKRRKRKRVQKEIEPDSDGDDDESEVSVQEPGAADIQDFDFEFVEMEDDDYHCVSSWLKGGTWDFVDVNFAELTDSIVGQGNIGSVVKSTSGDEDKEPTVCGLLTALNLRQFEDVSWPGMLRKSLLAKAKKHASPEVHAKFDALLGGQHSEGTEVGLVLSERFHNLPMELVAPLHKSLQEDIEWSSTTPECAPEEQLFYHFTHFVGIAKCNVGGGGASSSTEGSTKKRRREGGASTAAAASGGPTFYRPEDEVYVSKAQASFTFPVATSEKSQDGSGRSAGFRAVFLLTKKGFRKAVAEVGSLGAAA